MHTRGVVILLAALMVVAGSCSPVWAAGQVRLELVGGTQGSAMAFQDWMEVLGRAGVKNVRFRSAGDPEKPGVEAQGTERSPLYVVTGVVVSRDELLLPGGRFTRGDAARLARWLDDLAANGPPERRPKKVAFGLTKEQFAQLHAAAAQLVGFSTRGMPRAEVVEKIGRRLQLALSIDPGVSEAIGNEHVTEELYGLSCGTALASVLRPAGYCLLPREVNKAAGYAVVKAKADVPAWPVGWDPPNDTPVHDVLPALFEFHNVKIDNVPVAQALEAIAQRLKVPMLMDHSAMARYGIDPAKALVSLPQSRTTYSIALRKLLFQARLKFEVRLDEADHPFLWITTLKPA